MGKAFLFKRTSTNHQDLSIEAQNAALRTCSEVHGRTGIMWQQGQMWQVLRRNEA